MYFSSWVEWTMLSNTQMSTYHMNIFQLNLFVYIVHMRAMFIHPLIIYLFILCISELYLFIQLYIYIWIYVYISIYIYIQKYIYSTQFDDSVQDNSNYNSARRETVCALNWTEPSNSIEMIADLSWTIDLYRRSELTWIEFLPILLWPKAPRAKCNLSIKI